MNSVKSRGTALLMAGLYSSLMLTAALAAPQTKSKTNTAAVIEAGKKVYAKNGCGGCHAIGGKGGTSGPNLSKVGADPKHTIKWLEEQITNPKSHKEDSTMPPYEDKIKGKDLTALATYLASLKK